jgi:hypothetical protein
MYLSGLHSFSKHIPYNSAYLTCLDTHVLQIQAYCYKATTLQWQKLIS